MEYTKYTIIEMLFDRKILKQKLKYVYKQKIKARSQ